MILNLHPKIILNRWGKIEIKIRVLLDTWQLGYEIIYIFLIHLKHGIQMDNSIIFIQDFHN